MAFAPLTSLNNEECYSVIMEMISTIVGIIAGKTGLQETIGVILMIALHMTACPIDSLNT